METIKNIISIIAIIGFWIWIAGSVKNLLALLLITVLCGALGLALFLPLVAAATDNNKN